MRTDFTRQEESPSPASSSIPVSHPGFIESFIKGFVSRAPEDLAGGPIAGLGDLTGSQFLTNLGDSIANASGDEIKADMAKIDQMPWFDETTPWYDVHPSRIKDQVAKVSAMMGEGLPFLIQNIMATKVGRMLAKPLVGAAVGGVAGAELGPGDIAAIAAGAVASDVLLPASVMGLASIHSFYRDQRAQGIDDDLIRANAVKYGMINGLMMTLRSQAAIGATVAGAAGTKSVISKSAENGMRFVVSRLLKSAGMAVPPEIEMAGFNVGSEFLNDLFTKDAQAKMQARYGNQWAPAQEKASPTVADYVKSAAEGALFGGAMRLAGFAKRLVTGKVDAEGQEAHRDALRLITGQDGRVLLRSDTEGAARAIAEYAESRFGKKTLEADKNNPLFGVQLKIAALVKTGRMDDAVNLIDKHAETTTLSDSSNAKDIMAWVKAREDAKNLPRRGLDPVTGKYFFVGDDALFGDAKRAEELFHDVRLTVNDGEESNWRIPFTKEHVANDIFMAEAMQLPYTVDRKTGEARFTEENQAKLDKARSLALSYIDAPEGSLHAGSPFYMSFVNGIRMTEDKVRQLGYGDLIKESTQWVDRDGKSVDRSDPNALMVVAPSAGNRFETLQDGSKRLVMDVNYGRLGHDKMVEELLESPLKDRSNTDPRATDHPTVLAQGRFLATVKEWIKNGKVKLDADLSRLQSTRKTFIESPNAEDRKDGLIREANELLTHIGQTKIPSGRSESITAKEIEALRGEMESSSMGEDASKTFLNRLRKMQHDANLLTDADVAADLHGKFTRALTNPNAMIELFSHAWNVTQFGNVDSVGQAERNKLAYLEFDKATADAIRTELKNIHGEKLFNAMEADGKPIEAKAYYKSPADVQKEFQAQVLERLTAIENQIRDLVAKGQVPPEVGEQMLKDARANMAPSGDDKPVAGAQPVPSPVSSGRDTAVALEEPPFIDETQGMGHDTTKGAPQTFDGMLVPEAKLDMAEPQLKFDSKMIADEFGGVKEDETKTASFSMDVAPDTTTLTEPIKLEFDGEVSERDIQSAFVEALKGDAKHLGESKRYRPFVKTMGTKFGGYKRAETTLVRMIKESTWLKDAVYAESPEGFKAALEAKAGDPLAIAAFKSLARDVVNHPDEKVRRDQAWFKSMFKFYESFTPVWSGYASLGGKGTTFIGTNRYDRFQEFKESIRKRLGALSGNPIEQHEVAQLVKGILAKGEFKAPQNRAAFGELLERTTGINKAIWLSVQGENSQKFWDGMQYAYSAAFDSSGRLKHESWVKFAEEALFKSVGFPSNVRNLVNLSGDSHGFDFHSTDHNNQGAIGALVESPGLDRIRIEAARRGVRVDEMFRIVHGAKHEGTDGVDWDRLTDAERLKLELNQFKDGYYRVVPMGDKTAGYFMKFEKLATVEALKRYKALYDLYANKAESAPYMKELITPEQLAKDAAATTTPDGTASRLYGQYVANLALVAEQNYGMLYGRRSAYDANINKMVVRGSQVFSGGAKVDLPFGVLVLKAAPGSRLDGQMVHRAEFTEKFAKHMGSQYESRLIKTFIRHPTIDFGLKQASTDIRFYGKAGDPLYDGLKKIFDEHPEIDAITDLDSTKYGKDDLKVADVWEIQPDGSIGVKASSDLSGAVVSMPAGSMYIVQNAAKHTETVRDLLSRQMTFNASHLPRAQARQAISNRIMDSVLKELTDPASGDPSVYLRKIVKSDTDPDLYRYLLEMHEHPENILHNDRVFQKIATFLRSRLEPKTNRSAATMVSIGGKDIPGFGKDATGQTLLPWIATNVRNTAMRFEKGRWKPAQDETTGKKVLLPLRKAKPFASRAEALSAILADRGMHADLYRPTEDGIPTLGGEENLRPDAIREHDGKFWVGGFLSTADRIPSDSLLSGCPNRVADKDIGMDDGEISVAAKNEKARQSTGEDFDADAAYGSTFFVDENGRMIFDESPEGLMNRRLNLLAQDYYDTPVEYFTSDPALGGKLNDIEGLKKFFMDLAEQMPSWKAASPRNSRAFYEEQLNLNVGGKQMLGALAKSNAMLDVETLTGMWYRDRLSLGKGTIKVSVSEAEAKALASPAGFKDRMFLKLILGRGLINFDVDDPKNPHIAHLMDINTVGMAHAAIRGMHLTPENYQAELTKFFTWLNTNPIVMAYRKAAISRAESGLSYAKMWDTIPGGKESDVYRLWEIAQARRAVSRMTDAISVSDPPANVMEHYGKVEEQDSILSDAILGKDRKIHYSTGAIAESGFAKPAVEWLKRLGYYAAKNITGSRGWDMLMKDAPGFMTKDGRKVVYSEAKEGIYKAVKQAIIVKAIREQGSDAIGLPARFEKVKGAYAEDHPAQAFLSRMQVFKDKAGPRLGGLEELAYQEVSPGELKLIRDGFDAMTPKDKADFAEYTFQKYGTTLSRTGGGFHAFIGDKFHSEIDKAVMAEQKRWTEGQIEQGEAEKILALADARVFKNDATYEELSGESKARWSTKWYDPPVAKEGVKIVRPVIDYQGTIYRGESGQSHNDIIAANPALKKIANPKAKSALEANRKFETSTGEIVDRARGAEIAKTQGIEAKIPGQLHSSDLKPARSIVKQVADQGTHSMQASEDADSYGTIGAHWLDKDQKPIPRGMMYVGLSRNSIANKLDGSISVAAEYDDMFGRNFGEKAGFSVTDDDAQARDYAIRAWNKKTDPSSPDYDYYSEKFDRGDVLVDNVAPVVVAITPEAWANAVRSAKEVRSGQDTSREGLRGEQRAEFAPGLSISFPRGSFSIHNYKYVGGEEGNTGFIPLAGSREGYDAPSKRPTFEDFENKRMLEAESAYFGDSYSASAAHEDAITKKDQAMDVLDRSWTFKNQAVLLRAKDMLKSYPTDFATPVAFLREKGLHNEADAIEESLKSPELRLNERRSYSMQAWDQEEDTISQLDTGKYGVHRAYYEAADLMKAKSNTAAGHIAGWYKTLPAKEADAWEAITREIDEPGTLDPTIKADESGKLKALFDDEKVRGLVDDVSAQYAKTRADLNTYMQALTPGEWVGEVENYINRTYRSRSPEAMRELKRWSLDAKHTKERQFPTIREAEKMGFKLAVTNAGELFREYSKTMWDVSARSVGIHKMIMIRDGSGDMMMVPLFVGQRLDQPPVLHGHEMPSLNQGADNLAQVVEDSHSPTATWKGMKEAFDKFTGKADFQKRGYVKMDSPYSQYAGFWVHPDAMDAAKMVLDKGFDNRAVKTMERINNWSKFMTLGLSLFHPFALWEATVSALHGDAFKLDHGIIPRYAWNVDATFKAKMQDPLFQEMWIRSGLNVSPNPNLDSGMISRDLRNVMGWAEDHGNKPVALMAKSMMKYKEFMDKHLWSNFHSRAKLYTAEYTMNKYREQALKQGLAWNEEKMREEVAATMNQGFGGLNFDRMAWATPKVRQMMHLFMFAPDWTLTNFTSARAGVAGLGEALAGSKRGSVPGLEFLGKGLNETQKKWALTVHWPAMLTFMLAWPNVMQAAIYAAFGDPDKGDKPFAAENEKDKAFTVDVTPMFRKLGIYHNPDNPNERSYMRFAKQAWEVADMAMNPIQSLKGKSSAAFRIAYEQVTGDNTLGRKFAFQDENLWNGMFGSDKGWIESRTGTIVQKFEPMSLVTWLGGQPPTFLAPVSKGMTRAKTEIEIQKALTAYADPSVWAEITRQPGYEEKLDALVPEIIDAAGRNGVNVKEALKSAQSHVISKYYDRFWRALNRNDATAMEEASLAIVRLHGGIQGFETSVRNKEGRVNEKPTAQDVRLIREYWSKARGEIAPPRGVQPSSQSRKSLDDYLASL